MGFWWVVGSGGVVGMVVVIGLFGCRERDIEAWTEMRERGVIDNLLIILLYNIYYFNMLYCKIKVEMLGVL